MTSWDSDAATGSSARPSERSGRRRPARRGPQRLEERGQRRAGHGVVPDRHREQRTGRAVQTAPTTTNSMTASGRLTADVEDVAPAALVGELGPQRRRATPPAERPVGMGGRARRLAQRTPAGARSGRPAAAPSIATPSRITPTPDEQERRTRPTRSRRGSPNAKIADERSRARSPRSRTRWPGGWESRTERPGREASRFPDDARSPTAMPAGDPGPRPARPGSAAVP